MATAVERLMEAQRDRIEMVHARDANMNRAGAKLRGYLGWTANLSKAKSEQVCRRAQAVVKAVQKATKTLRLEGLDSMQRAIVIKSFMSSLRNPKGKLKLDAEQVSVAVAHYNTVLPYLTAAAAFEPMIANDTAEMEDAVQGLPAPVLDFVRGIRGMTEFGLAIIVGVVGDFMNYSTVAKVWKRCGLGVHEGKAPSTWKKYSKESPGKEGWIEMGYDSDKRSAIFTVGDPLIKQGVEYRGVYLAAKIHYEETHPEWTPMRRHRAAQRFMEKRLLKHIWQVWHGQCIHDTQEPVAVPTAVEV